MKIKKAFYINPNKVGSSLNLELDKRNDILSVTPMYHITDKTYLGVGILGKKYLLNVKVGQVLVEDENGKLSVIEMDDYYKLNAGERVPKYKKYYYIDENGDINDEEEQGDEIDENRWLEGNYFYTKEYALQYLQVNNKVQEKGIITPQEFYDNPDQYYIVIKLKSGSYTVYMNVFNKYIEGALYFKSLSAADNYINKYLAFEEGETCDRGKES